MEASELEKSSAQTVLIEGWVNKKSRYLGVWRK